MLKPDGSTYLILFSNSRLEVFIISAVLLFTLSFLRAEELPSIAKMPNFPENYFLRDWKQTAKNFDALIFDADRTGEFLPLLWYDDSQRVNDLDGFALPSYVGDSRQTSKSNQHEAITGIAAVLGSTLAGIDKSRHAPMIAIHYHKKNRIGLYLNQAGTVGDSFWYDLLPGLLFLHVFDRHPEVSGFQDQLISNAERWREIAKQLDGNFDYTGYNFHTRKPVNRGWSEADVSAGIACLLYGAWQKTGDRRFFETAEQCLRWMNERKENPYYESLLPYGAYISSRFNAMHGGSHKTAKFIEWVLAGDNPRKWGAMLETWNETPVHGLIGSVYPEYEYAFCMNSFQAVGIMAPIARYEDQYARDLAKWILNVAANGRYFYPDAWEATHQSSFQWSSKYDPNFCIPYEGIRRQGKTRNYPSNDQMKKGRLRLGNSTNPDKDMLLTADQNGSIHYEGIIMVPSGLNHSLIAVVKDRSTEDDTRIFLASDEKHLIQFRNQRSDVLKIPVEGIGERRIVIKADGLEPEQNLRVQDIVIETSFDNPPHVGGDAIDHGWGGTDLGIYGGSYAGFLAAMIETTNVEGILAIDPVATEVLLPEAYPTRLFFNPHPESRRINWDLGKESVQVYDAIENKLLSDSAQNNYTFEIPGEEAVMLVFPPAYLPLKKKNSKLLCGSIVVDYRR